MEQFIADNERIHVRLNDIDHLFEPRLLNPFKGREMTGSGMDIIYMKVRTYSPRIPLLLNLNLPSGEYDKPGIEAAIKKFCDIKTDQARLDHQILKQERYFGIITGLFFLTLCLVISFLLMMQTGIPEFLKFYLKEGLFIVGWVSMWRPTEVLLFDWWPYRKQIKTYNYIKHMRVVITIRE